MPLPSFLQIFSGGGTPSQPERAEDDVPETPQSPIVKAAKQKDSSSPNASSPGIPDTNGTVTPPDSDTSKSAKRKRQSDPEREKKTKKNHKSDKFVEDEPASESKSERQQARKARKQKQKKQEDRSSIPPTTPSAQHAPEMSIAESLDTEQATTANQTPAPATPKLEGSLTPGGRVKAPRGSRTREKDSLKIGFYTPQEVEKIETFKLHFCTTHGLPSSTFDEMVQHSERGGNGDFPVSTDVITKADFWNDIYALVPDRDRRSVYRFMRRHFQTSTQKAHDWTKEQEEELIRLIDHHGPKWTYIGKLLGRSDDDVTQRWKNKLEHQGKMNRGPWSEDETRTFLNAMEASWHDMKAAFNSEFGKDFYDLDDKYASWTNISKAMGHRRSRQQCADKWRKVVRHVKTMRANGVPDAVFDPKMAAKTVATWNARQPDNQKSAEFVDEDDDDVANESPENNKPLPDVHADLAKVLAKMSDMAQPVPPSENEAETEPEAPKSLKKAKNSNSKRKRSEEVTSDAAVQPDNQAQAEEDDEHELPSHPKKSKRRHANTFSEVLEEPPSSLASPKKTKAERKREKKEQKELQEKEDQARAEVQAKKDRKAARKEAKRAEMEGGARLAAQLEIPESPKSKSSKKSAKKSTKKSKQVSSDEADSQDDARSSRSNSAESLTLPERILSAAAASDQDESDSKEMEDSDPLLKREYESDGSDEL